MKKKKPLMNKIQTNYTLVALFFALLGLCIIAKAGATIFIDGSEWRKINENMKANSQEIPPKRGNIFSSDGELMAATEERYRLYMDFWAHNIDKGLTKGMIDTLTTEMRHFLPDSTVRYFRSRVESGLRDKKRYEEKKIQGDKKATRTRRYRVMNTDVNYTQLKKIKELPFFKKGPNQSGLISEPITRRVQPYGTLAMRTIGNVYGKKEKDRKMGAFGLENHYDSLLMGVPGVGQIQRINGRNIQLVEKEPIDGKDLITTIDIGIQELAERALINKLKDLNAESGTAIVMEVETGYVKAIANIGQNSRGQWSEYQNYGVSYMIEPGSTFKVVSMMIGIDDGLIHPNDSIETGNGAYSAFGPTIYDHNYNRGGYGKINASLSIRYSSNIGVARLIHNAYKDNPQKYLDGIKRIGAFEDMKLEIPGYGLPRIRYIGGPGWSKLSLPWMSYGYENRIPPIYTLAFFNAIANDGELVKPLFVKAVMEDGKVVENKKKVVLNPEICKSSTLKEIRQMLDDVVNGERGTGASVRSRNVTIAGKTGTAQIRGNGGVIEGHQVSFCGYYPVESPKYSCIVVIRKPRVGNPSGGLMAGSVFKQIAEGIYARNLLPSSEILPLDSLHEPKPIIKVSLDDLKIDEGIVPNVKGMGAKEAVYALESLGLKVDVSGRGTVKAQTVQPGTKIKRGETIRLRLE